MLFVGVGACVLREKNVSAHLQPSRDCQQTLGNPLSSFPIRKIVIVIAQVLAIWDVALYVDDFSVAQQAVWCGVGSRGANSGE